jgi:tripartite-type tricarboxylate transporter receptor subunit TctC
MKRIKWLGLPLLVLLLSIALVACGGGNQQPATPGGQTDAGPQFPTRPMNYMVTWDPGGNADIEARRQQPVLQEIFGQRIDITYHVGGGGAIGWAELVNRPPDGYSFATINVPHIILQPIERADAGGSGYLTEQIRPIMLFQGTPIGLSVQLDSPINTLDDFVAHARANPGSITVGGSGTMSGHHLAQLMFDDMFGTELTYVPFTGMAPQVQAFLGGHVDAIFANSDTLVMQGDQMRILAIAAEERFPQTPDVPTFRELGHDLVVGIERGVGAPPGTPPEIMRILSDGFVKLMERQDIQQAMFDDGFIPLFMDMDASLRYIEEMTVIYGDLLRDLLGM